MTLWSIFIDFGSSIDKLPFCLTFETKSCSIALGSLLGDPLCPITSFYNYLKSHVKITLYLPHSEILKYVNSWGIGHLLWTLQIVSTTPKIQHLRNSSFPQNWIFMRSNTTLCPTFLSSPTYEPTTHTKLFAIISHHRCLF